MSGERLYEGKAKVVYAGDDADHLILHFKDDTSAFDGQRVEQLAGKGQLNNHFNAFIMQRLQEAGVPTHFEALISDVESRVKRLEMIPVECVVRNRVTGSLAKRLGMAEGAELDPPVFEFFLKNDTLHDPMVNESHIRTFGWASEDEIRRMKELALKVNGVLKDLFARASLILADFKLEFGRFHGQLLLGDEFSPDGCRLWDARTLEKMDKDRFRRNLGGVVEAYREVARRLGVPL